MEQVPLVIRYALFAGIATILNLISQSMVFQVIPGKVGFYLGMATGIGTGLIVKYILDKRWIFFDTSSGIKQNARQFMVYSFFGMITTVLFLATEIGFDYLFGTHTMRLLGGGLGLILGYWVKYQLDCKYTFRRGETS